MKKTFAGFVVTALTLSGGAHAQEIGAFDMEAGVSTLGVYVAPKVAISETFGLRAPLHFGGYSDTFVVEGNDVDGKLGVTNGTLMVDYSPWANAFRMSGGAGIGGYNATGEVTDLTLDGNTFSGTSTVKVAQKSQIAPVLSLGFSHDFANGISIFGDVGARVATYETSVNTTIALTPTEQADLDASLADINDDLAKVWATPFVTFGIGYKF